MSGDPAGTAAARFSLAPYRPLEPEDLVRVGRNRDGGYVINRRCIAGTRVLVGLGIGGDWSFERQFAAANPDVRVVGVDGAISAAHFRDAAAGNAREAKRSVRSLRPGAGVYHLRVAAAQRLKARSFGHFFDGTRHHFVNKNLGAAESASMITWSNLRQNHTFLRGTEASPEVFVKVDIEGAEYQVLPTIVADGAGINGMVVEFHECDVHWDRFAELMLLMSDRFAVSHVHGNNYSPLIPGSHCPSTLEISFINRRLVPAKAKPAWARYPIAGLDRANDDSGPDYPLEFDSND